MCPPVDPFVSDPNEGTVGMIVIGTDTHKVTHTAAAVIAATGRVVDERTVRAKRRSFDDLLQWARALDADRVWALDPRPMHAPTAAGHQTTGAVGACIG